jgi:hypothetical protein
MIVALGMAASKAQAAVSQPGNGLTTIVNPAGGQVVYGPITHTTSLRDAMVTMLSYVHKQFGDRPQIGKFFVNKGNGSVGTFFHLTAKSQGGKPVAGMVIVSLAQGSTDGVAAVMYDDAGRFAKSEPALVQKLNAAWQKDNAKLVSLARESGARQSGGGIVTRGNGPGGIFGTNEPATASVPLHLAKSPDNSGSIGLPDGWHVTGGSGGSLLAEGNHGELIRMGVLVGNIYDPHTPQGAQMLNYMSKGSTASYACSYSLDLISDFLCVTNQYRQRQRLSPMAVNVISSRLSPQDSTQGAFLVEMDTHDGKGPYLSSLRLGVKRMGPGSWIMTEYEVRIPKPYANDEWSTAAGMIMSYRQNEAVIRGETVEVINRINREAAAARQLADAKSKANDAHNAQVEATWDEQARQNKAFENYTLDYAVLHDPQTGGSYGRADYPTAEALVTAAPDRFQYANTQDLLKGIDY